jgi:hypothetical protein
MTEYLEAAALLIEHDKSLSSNRNIFLSTDDADIIDDIVRGAFDHMNFTLYYTRYDRFATEVRCLASIDGMYTFHLMDRYERRSDDISPGGLAINIGPGLFGR